MGLRHAWNTFSAGSAMWGVLPSSWQAAVVTGLSAVTGYLTYPSGGLAWALVLAAAFFALGMAGVFFSLRVSSMLSVFQRLSVATTGISQAGWKEEDSFVTHLNANLTLRNDSQRLLFYRLHRAYLIIARQTADDQSVDRTIQIIQMGGTTSISLQTLQNIPFPKGGGEAPKGKLELEVEYGPSRDSLPYLFRYVADVFLAGGFAEMGGKNVIQLALHAVITELEHKRNPNV